MRERLEQILKIVCVGLAVLLLVQLVKAAVHLNPLAGATIPELPSLPVDTNAPVTMASKGLVKSGTNAAIPATNLKTNASWAASDTNSVSRPKPKHSESNSAPVQVSAEASATNNLGTNVLTVASTDTNAAVAKVTSGTNVPDGEAVKTNKAKAVVAKTSGPKKPEMMFPPMMGGPGGKKAPSLPPEVQARVDRVTESEILGPVIHPMPMALLGIAGKVALLRSPSGQTGLVKEGDDLGEIKLLRIGTNRVLVEQDGQKKELMIFAGFGGDTLLPKQTDTPDETTKN